MTSINWIGFLSFLIFPLVISEISWENCDRNGNGINLVDLTVTPDPIITPGLVSINITIHSNQNITGPIKATLALKKRLLFTYISVPCFIIGSCIYNDLCAICTHCHCPMEAGEQHLNLPLTIDGNSWMVGGKYQAEIKLEISSGQNACVKINNIDIRSRK